MPQLGVMIDNRVACETTIHNNNNNNKVELEQDLPAESYWVAKEDELEWIDNNAYAYSSSASIFHRTHSSRPNRTLNNNSQRFSHLPAFKSKPSIIGLPKPPPTTTAAAAVRRPNPNPSAARFFPAPKRSASSSSDPSSPKVSCIGRVRSKKARAFKCRASRRRQASPPRKKSGGFWSGFRQALRIGCRGAQAVEVQEGSGATAKAVAPPRSGPAGTEPPGLGAMNRFASGRRPGAWGSADPGLRSGGPRVDC